MTTINSAYYAHKEKSSLSIFTASDIPRPGGLIELCKSLLFNKLQLYHDFQSFQVFLETVNGRLFFTVMNEPTAFHDLVSVYRPVK